MHKTLSLVKARYATRYSHGFQAGSSFGPRLVKVLVNASSVALLVVF